MTAGETVRKLRIARGETLCQFASRVQVSLSFVSDIEHGRRALPLSSAAKWEKTLNLEAGVLVQAAIQARLEKLGITHLKVAVSLKPLSERLKKETLEDA